MWGWKKYVPVAKRRAQAKSKINRLQKKGEVIEPVEVQGRSIAKKFWGKKWCEHIETFSDFENRLPRGRTYVRNGSVCHLRIREGLIEALVIGSSLYTIEIKIKTLSERHWKLVKERCSGQIGSLLEVLTGKLSDHVMEVVADPQEGLFPSGKEISFGCNCPDWADMCKHVAAVLYGIAVRLDESPDLLFLLRGVNAQELVTTKLTTDATKTDDLLQEEGLSEIFGIDMDEESSQLPEAQGQNHPLSDLKKVTGKDLQLIRLERNLTVKEFAKALGCTPASIYRWEKKEGVLNFQDRFAKEIGALLYS